MKKVLLHVMRTTLFVLIVSTFIGGCSTTYNVDPKKGYVTLDSDTPVCSSRRKVHPTKYLHTQTNSVFYSFCEGKNSYDGIEVQNDTGLFSRKSYSQKSFKKENFKKVDDPIIIQKANKYVDSFYLLDLENSPQVAIVYTPKYTYGNDHVALDAPTTVFVNKKNEPTTIQEWVDNHYSIILHASNGLAKALREQSCSTSKLFPMLDHSLASTNANVITSPLLRCYWKRVEESFQKNKNNLAKLEQLHRKYPNFFYGTAIYLEALLTHNKIQKAKNLIQALLQEAAPYKSLRVHSLLPYVKRGIVASPKENLKEKIALLDFVQHYLDPKENDYKTVVALKIVLYATNGASKKAETTLKTYLNEQKNASYKEKLTFVEKLLNLAENNHFDDAEKIAVLKILKAQLSDPSYRSYINKINNQLILYSYNIISKSLNKKEVSFARLMKKYNISDSWDEKQLQSLYTFIAKGSFPLRKKIALLQSMQSYLQNSQHEKILRQIQKSIRTYTLQNIQNKPKKLKKYLAQHPEDTEAKQHLLKIAQQSYVQLMQQKDKRKIVKQLQELFKEHPELKIVNYSQGDYFDKNAYEILKQTFQTDNITTINLIMNHLTNVYWTKFAGRVSEMSAFGGIFGNPAGRSVKINYIISNLSLAIENNVSKNNIVSLMDNFNFAVNFKSPYKSNVIATSRGSVLSAQFYWFVENPINTAIKYKRYDLLPILTKTKYFKRLPSYPKGYRYLNKKGVMIDAMLTLKDVKGIKLLEKHLHVSIENIFDGILDSIYGAWDGPRARIKYAKKFKPFVSKKSYQKLLKIEEAYNKYEEEQDRRLAQKRNSPCYKKYKKCLSYCDMKSNKNGSLLTSSDKNKCVSSCYLGKNYCEEGKKEKAKSWFCDGMCEGIDKYNGTLFRASSFTQCVRNCKAQW